MGRTVILETHDGWRKRMGIEDNDRNWLQVKQLISPLRDTFDISKDVTYMVRHFQWDGEMEQERMPDGTVGAIEVWRER
jgi:hypothetical protein